MAKVSLGREVALGWLAAALAFVGVRSWPAPDVEAPALARVPQSPARSPAEPCAVPTPSAPAPRPVDRHAALRDRLAARRDALALTMSQENAVMGAPLPWPNDVAEEETEAYVTEILEGLAGDTGGAMIHLDCREFPCVAVLDWGGDESEGSAAEGIARIREIWPEVVEGSYREHYFDGQTVRSHTFAPLVGGLGDEQRRRVDVRLSEAVERTEP